MTLFGPKIYGAHPEAPDDRDDATDARPVISKFKADAAALQAGEVAAREAARTGGDPAALAGLMTLAEAARAGDLKALTLDVLLAVERRDALFADVQTSSWADLAHMALCFNDPPRAWAALDSTDDPKRAFATEAFKLAGHISVERLTEVQAIIRSAFDALKAAHSPAEAPAAAAAENPPEGDAGS